MAYAIKKLEKNIDGLFDKISELETYNFYVLDDPTVKEILKDMETMLENVDFYALDRTGPIIEDHNREINDF